MLKNYALWRGSAARSLLAHRQSAWFFMSDQRVRHMYGG